MTLLLTSFLAGAPGMTIACLVGAVAGIFLSIRGFLLGRSKPTIALSRISQAQLGTLDVSGCAAGPYTVTAPLTGTACFAYRTVAWRQTGSSAHQEEIVAEERLHVPFFLDDRTGKLLVDPTGADLDLRQDFRHEFQNSRGLRDNPDFKNLQSFLQRHRVDEGGRLRVEEFCMKPNNFVFIHGTLAKNPGLAVGSQNLAEETTHAELKVPQIGVMIGTLDHFSGQVPLLAGPEPAAAEPLLEFAALQSLVDLTTAAPVAQSSRDMTQQGKIAAALERAGILMPDIRTLMVASETENSVEPQLFAAQNPPVGGRESDSPESPEVISAPEADFDMKPVLVLLKGKSNSQYFISWRDRRAGTSTPLAVKLMRWGGPALALLGLAGLAGQLGWL